VNVSLPSGDMLAKYIRDGRTFILHDNSYSYEMTNVRITPAHDTISGDVTRSETRNETHGSHKKVYYHYMHRIPPSIIEKQVHLFTNLNLTGKNAERRIAVDSFTKMHDLQFDKGKTTRNHIGTAVGIFAGVTVLAIILGSMA